MIRTPSYTLLIILTWLLRARIITSFVRIIKLSVTVFVTRFAALGFIFEI